MATAAVSSSSLQQTLESFLQQRGTDLQQLGHALEHGDLAAAQSAYSALQTLAQNGPFSGAHAFNLTRRQQEFAAIGRDLQSGNLAAAQRAFAELRANRASDPANADGSQPLPPAAVIEISVQGDAAADAAASDSAAANTAAPPSPVPATVATPILTAAPASTAAAASPGASSAPAGALEVPPPAEPLVTLTLQGGNSGGIEIDLTFASPATPAPISTPATGSAAAPPAASASSASPAATGSGASPAASTAPEIVLNLSPGALAAGSEIDISLSQSANGGELFSLGIGTQTNPSQEQININLAQNANEQIVLNLLAAGAGGSGGATSSAPGTLINISI